MAGSFNYFLGLTAAEYETRSGCVEDGLRRGSWMANIRQTTGDICGPVTRCVWGHQTRVSNALLALPNVRSVAFSQRTQHSTQGAEETIYKPNLLLHSHSLAEYGSVNSAFILVREVDVSLCASIRQKCSQQLLISELWRKPLELLFCLSSQ